MLHTARSFTPQGGRGPEERQVSMRRARSCKGPLARIASGPIKLLWLLRGLLPLECIDSVVF